MADTVVKKPIVTIEMEDGGIITIELYPSKAPETVNNFISLINKDFMMVYSSIEQSLDLWHKVEIQKEQEWVDQDME